jgi:hypothetical protein
MESIRSRQDFDSLTGSLQGRRDVPAKKLPPLKGLPASNSAPYDIRSSSVAGVRSGARIEVKQEGKKAPVLKTRKLSEATRRLPESPFSRPSSPATALVIQSSVSIVAQARQAIAHSSQVHAAARAGVLVNG